ncbi:MAG: phosphoglycerate mutase, partial [Anaerovorax sp.]
QNGEIGMVQTIPAGVAPGSDAANLSVMGYNPAIYLTGRSPLEAASIGIDMSDTDVAFRTNLVTLTGEGKYEDLIIADHSSGDISNEE